MRQRRRWSRNAHQCLSVAEIMGKRRITRPGGVSLNCLAEGPDGNAPWVVFGNSLMTDLSIWEAQVRALSDRFNVLRYDVRGHGASGIDETLLDFDILSRDLIAVMDGFSVEMCSYVGLSMGVPTGLAAYSDNRHRFQRLVFLDGQAQTAPTGRASWQERIDSADACRSWRGCHQGRTERRR